MQTTNLNKWTQRAMVGFQMVVCSKIVNPCTMLEEKQLNIPAASTLTGTKFIRQYAIVADDAFPDHSKNTVLTCC